MQPYDECVFNKERLRKYEGFEKMSTISGAYLMNRIKIDEYERIKLRQV